MKIISLSLMGSLFGLLLGASAFAAQPVRETITVTIFAVSADSIGAPIGTLTMHDTVRGVVIKPKLKNLSPGVHGFHLHENPDCSAGVQDDTMVAAHNAGGHYDPDITGMHHGPNSDGHRGDLPVLKANAAGLANDPVLAPQLKLEDVKGHAFVIHAGGDNYSDDPLALGGGGARIACGVVN